MEETQNIQYAASIIAGLVGMALSFKLIFREPGDFREAIRYWFTPDIVSMFRGEWSRDYWNEFKLGMWFLSGVISFYGILALFE